MDEFVIWLLAAIAACSFIAALVIDRSAPGHDGHREYHLLIAALALVSIGTFLVSTIGITDTWLEARGLVTGFNRAVLAGAGVTVLWRSVSRYRRAIRG